MNIGIVAALTSLGAGYLLAAVCAAEFTIVMNFLLQERFVFHDLRHEGRGVWRRFGSSFAFNNAETLVRLPLLALLVQTAHVAAVPATAVTLLIAFLARFTFHARVIYRPRSSRRSSSLPAEAAPLLDERA